ncbi:Polyketide cyclase / dehydrase and lipid transport [Micromonospora marina]|uniref:Polyketide cyclase / dehydrase and lipid transport n=1 Tax=Micromonospora marina TaxID=307120 RepID=A0A1C4ZGS6_9ACTN|nr:Polyketide cyclase / dehydrase and lipid transport [Micromonospora marina]
MVPGAGGNRWQRNASVRQACHHRRVATEFRHLSIHIDRPVAEVYAFAADPANLTRWAPGLGGSVVFDEGHWFVDTPQGRARLTFAPANEYGVLDHEVLTPSGETVYVPLRAIADGDATEVVFSLRRQPGMSDADFDRDTALVGADLARLKAVLESVAG